MTASASNSLPRSSQQKQIVDRNAVEFDFFVAEAGGGLFKLAFHLTRGGDSGHDLYQETLMRCYANWDKVKKAESAGLYVRRIMVNEFLRSRRTRRFTEHLVADLEPEPAREGRTTESEDRLFLRRMLNNLPPRQKATVVLRYAEDLSEAQVALIMGCSEGTVKSQLSKALRNLRSAISDEDEGN